jgi:hypothetical protein
MKDPADTKTLSLIDETVTKKRGRPATGKALSAAQRKAEQRKRDREKVLSDSHENWTKKDCLVVLNDPSMSLDMQRIAVRRLGVLFGDNHIKGE